MLPLTTIAPNQSVLGCVDFTGVTGAASVRLGPGSTFGLFSFLLEGTLLPLAPPTLSPSQLMA